MIKDKLANSNYYKNISIGIAKGFEWLKKSDLNSISDGKYLIDSENIYANVQTYTTKDKADFEAHRKYIDIQYMVSGKELIGVSQLTDCNTIDEYNPDKDIEFLTSSKHWQEILEEGDFMIFFPNDAHQPSLKYSDKQVVKKVVVKIKIN